MNLFYMLYPGIIKFISFRKSYPHIGVGGSHHIFVINRDISVDRVAEMDGVNMLIYIIKHTQPNFQSKLLQNLPMK